MLIIGTILVKIGKDDALTHPFTYLIILGAGGTTVFWLIRLNRHVACCVLRVACCMVGLSRAIASFESVFIIPVLQALQHASMQACKHANMHMQVWWTTLCIVSGVVYFKEFAGMMWYEGLVFVLGMLHAKMPHAA